MKKFNRAETIKKKIIQLLLLLLGFYLLIVAAIITVCLWPSFNFKGTIPAAITLCTLLIFVVTPCFLFKATVILKPLSESVLLDTDEINKMLDKSTAPFRQKNYHLLKLLQKKDEETAILKEELEKIYFKLKNSNRDRRN